MQFKYHVYQSPIQMSLTPSFPHQIIYKPKALSNNINKIINFYPSLCFTSSIIHWVSVLNKTTTQGAGSKQMRVIFGKEKNAKKEKVGKNKNSKYFNETCRIKAPSTWKETISPAPSTPGLVTFKQTWRQPACCNIGSTHKVKETVKDNQAPNKKIP